jgi:hypothetical protein
MPVIMAAGWDSAAMVVVSWSLVVGSPLPGVVSALDYEFAEVLVFQGISSHTPSTQMHTFRPSSTHSGKLTRQSFSVEQGVSLVGVEVAVS